MFDFNRIRVGGNKIEKDIYRYVTVTVADDLLAVEGTGYSDDEIVAVLQSIADKAGRQLVGFFYVNGVRVCCNGKRFTVNGKVVFLARSLVTGWISQYKRGFAAWTSWDNDQPVMVLVVQDLYLDDCSWTCGDNSVKILLLDDHNVTAVVNGEVVTVDIMILLAAIANYGFER